MGRPVMEAVSDRLRRVLLSNLPAAGGALPYAPRTATLNLTDNCFFKCVMCAQWRTVRADELSTAEWRGVIEQLPALGLRHVSFAGGEPFMRKDLLELAAGVRAQGLSASVITNGYLLDAERLAQAVGAGLRTFGVSVDGVGPEFDRLRGVEGGFARVDAACRLLAAEKAKSGIEVHLYFTLMRPTLGSYREVFALARELGLPFVVNLLDHTPYFFQGVGARGTEFWIQPDEAALAEFQRFLAEQRSQDPGSVHALFGEIDYFRAYFADPVQKGIPCVASQERVGIDSRGQVFGGCWSLGHFGNVRERPLREILGSAAYREAHRRMLRKECPGCSCGYAANLRAHLPHRLSSLAYDLLPARRARLGARP